MQYEKKIDMWEIEKNADLLLINSYEALQNIRPSVPTTVYLGGIHQKSKTALSPELEEFMKKSDKVIYINLSNALSYYPTRLQKLVKALENAKVNIIWSINDEYVNTTATRIYQEFDLDQEAVLGEF